MNSELQALAKGKFFEGSALANDGGGFGKCRA